MKNLSLLFAMFILGSGMSLAQTYTVLWSFGSVAGDSANPYSSIISDSSGNLYGTTSYGGAYLGGTVFQLSPGAGGWTETILYNFCSNKVGGMCLDGAGPFAGLAFDAQGNLYGTTLSGGSAVCDTNSDNCGTVFELSPPLVKGGSWTETVLHNFCSNKVNNRCRDGANALSQLVSDASGNLYGTTQLGGTGNNYGGTVFELSPGLAGWTHTVIYNFCVNGTGKICPDGTEPTGGVIFDQSGNLFGTTARGGNKNYQGEGTVYELSPSAGGWKHTTLLNFYPTSSVAFPIGPVGLDFAGSLYVIASGGNGGVPGGFFKLNGNTHTEQVVVFGYGGDRGARPLAGIIVDRKTGASYGTTSAGGGYSFGNVFEIGASGKEIVLHSFCADMNTCTDGAEPNASLFEDAKGNLYGTTSRGGAYDQGVVFMITK